MLQDILRPYNKDKDIKYKPDDGEFHKGGGMHCKRKRRNKKTGTDLKQIVNMHLVCPDIDYFSSLLNKANEPASDSLKEDNNQANQSPNKKAHQSVNGDCTDIEDHHIDLDSDAEIVKNEEIIQAQIASLQKI